MDDTKRYFVKLNDFPMEEVPFCLGTNQQLSHDCESSSILSDDVKVLTFTQSKLNDFPIQNQQPSHDCKSS